MQVDEQVEFMLLSGLPTKGHVDKVAFTPCTGPAKPHPGDPEAVDFDSIKNGDLHTVY